MSHKFDKGIPIPAMSRASRHEFRKMEVGDSFLGDKNAVAAAATHKKRTDGWSYASRKEGDGVRIWRTA